MHSPLTLPPGPFDIFYADPAWHFTSNSKEKPGKNALGHYDCMSLAEIEAMPVKEVAAKDALLFLWVTVPFAELAFRVVKAWGFNYVSQLSWDKERTGTGFWARNEHEIVYICKRGKFPCPRPAPFPWSVIHGQRREHSRKPDLLHDQIDSVWPTARKLELFARESRPGWASWGNQATKFDVIPGGRAPAKQEYDDLLGEEPDDIDAFLGAA